MNDIDALVAAARAAEQADGWPASYWHLCIEQRAIEQKIMEIAEGVDDGR